MFQRFRLGDVLWTVLELCHFRASPPDQAQIKHLQRLETAAVSVSHQHTALLSHLFQYGNTKESRIIHVLARRTLFICAESGVLAPVKTVTTRQLSKIQRLRHNVLCRHVCEVHRRV